MVVTALNDRAFAIIKDESNPSSPALVLELRGTNCVATATGVANVDAGAKKAGDGKQGREARAKQQKQDGKHQSQKLRRIQEASDPPEKILAVCCTKAESEIWLAVSKEDKTLSLFSVSISMLQHQGQATTNVLYPTVTYNLTKRARCLAFSSGPNCIIVGDLAGDAISFPLPTALIASSVSAPVCSAANDTATGSTKVNVTTKTRRLLLGHTASMLTGLNVIPSAWDDKKPSQQQQQQFIISADRDEKVRVSFFPRTHIIHGYLLGHSSFISTLDAVATRCSEETKTLCVTGSGDGTVRLWDATSCMELGMVPVVVKQSDKVNKTGHEETLDEQEQFADKEESEQGEECGVKEDLDKCTGDKESFDGHVVCVPISVALSSSARYVIVARDGISSIHVHSIPQPLSSSSSPSSMWLSRLVSLHKKQILECTSQPLSVACFSDGSILVLVRGDSKSTEPDQDYLLHFQEEKRDSSIEFNNISSTSPFSVALRGAIRGGGCGNIIMPQSNLEYNKKGETNDFDDNTHKQGGGGIHWNNVGRKETARQAEQRRRKRRKNDVKQEAESKKRSSNQS